MKTITITISLFWTTFLGLYAQSLTAPSSTTLLCPDQEYTYQFIPPSNNTRLIQIAKNHGPFPFDVNELFGNDDDRNSIPRILTIVLKKILFLVQSGN